MIAKIEKAEAVDALDDILRETDSVMVARGDLGVEIGPALVPLVQKRIILAALDRAKPVITATQMLESMIHHAEPTRAEASDVANAILDGSSALMLSAETAVGDFPVEAVAYMDRIARAVEPSIGYRHELPQAHEEPTAGQAMSNAACDVAEALGAQALLVPTFTGRTASAVARLRPRRQILALSHHDYALRQLALEWGVTPIPVPEANDVEDLWAKSIEAARAGGYVSEGDLVVITAGTAVNLPGHDRCDQSRPRLGKGRRRPAPKTRPRWPVARRSASRAAASCSAGSRWSSSRSSRSSTRSRCGATSPRETRSRSARRRFVSSARKSSGSSGASRTWTPRRP